MVGGWHSQVRASVLQTGKHSRPRRANEQGFGWEGAEVPGAKGGRARESAQVPAYGCHDVSAEWWECVRAEGDSGAFDDDDGESICASGTGGY